MNIGIVGLGLIGGSLAKAFKYAGVRVLGSDLNKQTVEFAEIAEAIDGELTAENMSECDAVFVAITPVAAVKWMEENKENLTKDNIVIDCCGTKRYVCQKGFDMMKKGEITYVGGHPMAGKERGGFKNADSELFRDEPFVVVPYDHNDIELMGKVKHILKTAGFGKITYTTPEEHDSVIAFTSQMPHIVSNGFIKSDTAKKNINLVSAGSYKDFTRVARLDEKMWSELFMENKDNLIAELDTLTSRLEEYKRALAEDNMEELTRLLAEGKERKNEVDRICSSEI